MATKMRWRRDIIIVNPAYVKDLQGKGMQFVGHSTDGQHIEIMELAGKQTSLTIVE